MSPNTIGGKHRDVGEVTYTVAGDPDDAGLPRRLSVSLASPTHDATAARRSGSAAARPATAGGGCQKGRTGATIAKAGCAIGCTGAREVASNQRTGAGVVPRDLRHVGLGRAVVGSVARIPVGTIGAGVRIAEVRAADRYVVGSRGESVDADAMCCLRRVGITAGGAFVARGDENRYPLSHRLLVRRAVCRIRRGPIRRLALAVADAHDGWR